MELEEIQMKKFRYLNVFCAKSFNNKWSCSVSSKEFKYLIQLLMFIRGYKNAGGI